MLDHTAWLGKFANRPRRHKIAVAGFTSHFRQMPFHDDEWEMYLLNDLYHEAGAIFNRKDDSALERVTWFQLHAWVELMDHRQIEGGEFLNPQQGPPHPRDPNHLIWLKEASEHIPVYLIERRDELPDCLEFPKQAVYDFFQDGHGNPVQYFTNSITWMTALAILNLVESHTLPDGRTTYTAVKDAELGMWGVDMMQAGPTSDSEYSYQRPSVEWLLGYAMGLGIKVTVPSESDLLKSVYQYGDPELFYARRRLRAYKSDLQGQGASAAQTVAAAREQQLRVEGAQGAVEWFERAHYPGDDGAREGQLPEPDGNKVLAAGIGSSTVE